MKILNIFTNKKELSEEMKLLNLFADDISFREFNKLNEIQKKAYLCWWYDCEMNSGGHSGYFDCYPETNSNELYSALKEVSNIEIANNYKKAVDEGINDEYIETDNAYYNFSPSLYDYLNKYILENKEEIFK